MLQKGHYEIDYHHGGQIVTQYMYRAREWAAVVSGIVQSGGTIVAVREVEHA